MNNNQHIGMANFDAFEMMGMDYGGMGLYINLNYDSEDTKHKQVDEW